LKIKHCEENENWFCREYGNNPTLIRVDNLCDEILAFLDVLLKFWDTSIKELLLFGRKLADRVDFFNTVRLQVKKDDEPKKIAKNNEKHLRQVQHLKRRNRCLDFRRVDS
jgi:hypothetical protein